MATSEEKFNMKTEVHHDRVVSARATIIEVAIESSFQPMLQLYLLLPLLIDQFICYSKGQVFTASYNRSNLVSKIQLFSIISSVVSLSWSFSFYQSIKKKGALDFGNNMIGRILLLISNSLQISSRLLALIIYAYCFGPGIFWKMIASVLAHILVMSLLHFLTSDEWKWESFDGKCLKIMYHSLLNGICNLYLHNWITAVGSDSDSKMRKTTTETGTVYRQILFETIFLLQNLAIMATAYYKLSNLPYEVMIFIAVAQIVAISTKTCYYYHHHIWSYTFKRKERARNLTRFKQNIRGNALLGKEN